MSGRVAVIGADGQLGCDVALTFADRDVAALGHADVEIADAEQVRKVLRELRPVAVVNTAAQPHPGRCEEVPRLAFAVNADGALHLARACEELGALLVHVSTDYVFDGAKRAPYVETDPVAPVNVYGISKAAGEFAVRSYCTRHYVVRASGLYGRATCRAKGENFVAKMLRLARENGKVTVVDDEIVTPTETGGLARQIRRLVDGGDVPFGVVHASDEGACSWHEFAAEIFRQAGVAVELARASGADFPAPVKRPFYSVLENRVLADAGANEMSDWRESLARHLGRLADG
jgi:dTDP-4-dehydrorhamnose reductase